MKSELAKHFEDVEEKLRRLEDIALSPASFQEAETVLELGESKFDLNGTRSPADGSGPETLCERPASRHVIPPTNETTTRKELAFREVPSPSWNGLVKAHSPALPSLPHTFESQALQECRIQTRYLIQGAIEEARHRLKSLADAMIPQLQSNMEKALEKSASAAINRAAVSFEQQIRDVNGRSIDEAFNRRRLDFFEAGSEEKLPADNKTEGSQETIAQALAPAVEEIQSKSAAFLEDLRRQMQDTLRTFEENAAKRVSEEFQKTAGDLLEREIRQLHTSLGKTETPDEKIPPALENSPGGAEKPAGQAAASPVVSPTNGRYLDSALPIALRNRLAKHRQESSRRNQPTWRILGL